MGTSYLFMILLVSIALSHHTQSETENEHNLKHDHQHSRDTIPVKKHIFVHQIVGDVAIVLCLKIFVLFSQSSELWDEERKGFIS